MLPLYDPERNMARVGTFLVDLGEMQSYVKNRRMALCRKLCFSFSFSVDAKNVRLDLLFILDADPKSPRPLQGNLFCLADAPLPVSCVTG